MACCLNHFIHYTKKSIARGARTTYTVTGIDWELCLRRHGCYEGDDDG